MKNILLWFQKIWSDARLKSIDVIVTKVWNQSHLIKIHTKRQKSLNLLFSYFLKQLKESQLLNQKTPLGYGCITYSFEQSKHCYLWVLMICTSYSLAHPLVQRTFSLYIANKIAKDQYVCTTIQCTCNGST
jgi:hypothetical protein